MDSQNKLQQWTSKGYLENRDHRLGGYFERGYREGQWMTFWKSSIIFLFFIKKLYLYK
jgi:hypothetical protein